jgi:hypothetical protein
MKIISLKDNKNFILRFLDIPFIIEDNPISKFFVSFSVLIKIILDLPLFTKYLYRLVDFIHKKLYEIEEILFIDNQNESNLSFYFYLDLLIKYEENIINYEYTMEFIKTFNQMKNNNNNIFIK